jgi:hypothetical protein
MRTYWAVAPKNALEDVARIIVILKVRRRQDLVPDGRVHLHFRSIRAALLLASGLPRLSLMPETNL